MTDPTTLSDAALLDAKASALEDARRASQRFDDAAAAVDDAISERDKAQIAMLSSDRRYRQLVNEANRRRL